MTEHMKQRDGTKLTLADVIAIRKKYSERAGKGVTMRSIALEYGISKQMVHQIVTNQCWKEHKSTPDENQGDFGI